MLYQAHREPPFTIYTTHIVKSLPVSLLYYTYRPHAIVVKQPKVFNISLLGIRTGGLQALWNQITAHSVIEYLKRTHHFNVITSLSMARPPGQWNLGIECCGFQTPFSLSPPSSTVTVVVDPGTPDVIFNGISTSYTGPTISRNEPPGELIELKVNPFNTPHFIV